MASFNVCACGCGQTTPLASRNNKRRGWVKGEPLRYIHGHNGRKDNDLPYTVNDDTGCHVFTGSVSPSGYGVVTKGLDANGKQVKFNAHRLAWERAHGPVSSDTVIHHRCRNKSCINVEHLEPMERRDHARIHVTDGVYRSVAKLDEAQVRAIRSLQGRGTIIAKVFDVSPATVSMIRNNRIWEGV